MTIVISGIAGFPGGSVVPGIGNVVGLAAGSLGEGDEAAGGEA